MICLYALYMASIYLSIYLIFLFLFCTCICQTPYRPEIEVIDDCSSDSDAEDEEQDGEPSSLDIGECLRSERLFTDLSLLSESGPSVSGILDYSNVPDLEDVDAAAVLREEQVMARVSARTALAVTAVDQELEGLD